jgi:hypothetical protein
MEGPQVATSHGHPYARKFPDKKYFFGHSVPGKVPEWPLLMATLMPGSSLIKNIFWSFGPREGHQVATSDGHPYSRKFPEKNIFWSFGPREGHQVATPNGHPYARKFPDKK